MNYQRYGTTKRGADRFRCKKCKRVFSIPHPPERSRVPHARQRVHGFKNTEIFRELVNKVPLNSICRLRDIPFKLLIEKIHFIYKQCKAFNIEREQKLKELQRDDIYLSVDRQMYHVNWSHASDRRNTVLLAIGSAERYSGYVLGMHLNYDPTMDATAVNGETEDLGDVDKPAPYRKHARVWLKCDYEDKKNNKKAKEEHVETTNIETALKGEADIGSEFESNAEIIVFSGDDDSPNTDQKLPDKGMQVHSEYTMHGHFRYLKSMLPGVTRFVFYMDDESGIESVLNSTFTEEISNKRCEGFIVTINKELTISKKRYIKKKAEAELQRYIDANAGYSELSRKSVQQLYLEDMIRERTILREPSDAPLNYPFPDMSEPQKQVRWITDLEDRALNTEQIATLYRRATLHPIDRFFMQIRRGVSALERSMFTASNAGRVWHCYAAYNPERVVWLLEIYRTAYNYIFAGNDKKTPAMRLGLAKAPLRFEDIIYYQPDMD